MWQEFFYRILWFIFFECLPVFLVKNGHAPKIAFRGDRPRLKPPNTRKFR